MGQHDQERPVTPRSDEPAIISGSSVDAIDLHALFDDVLPILQRHGLIPPGERLDGWVGVLHFTGIDDNGDEYTRADLCPSPGVTLGQARQLLATGQAMLN